MIRQDTVWFNHGTNIFDVTREPRLFDNVGVDRISWVKSPGRGVVPASLVLNGMLPGSKYLMEVDDGLRLDLVYREFGPRAEYDPDSVLLRCDDCQVVEREMVRPVSRDPSHEMIILVTLDCHLEIFWKRWSSR